MCFVLGTEPQPHVRTLCDCACALTQALLQQGAVAGQLLLDGDVHALLLVGGVVLGQDAQQRTQLQPPLVLRDALPKFVYQQYIM